LRDGALSSACVGSETGVPVGVAARVVVGAVAALVVAWGDSGAVVVALAVGVGVDAVGEQSHATNAARIRTARSRRMNLIGPSSAAERDPQSVLRA